MKNFLRIILILITLSTSLGYAAIPTEEGLLRNLNNSPFTGKVITVKMAVKNEFMKLVFLLDKPGVISLLQVVYGDSQMQFAQAKDVKYFPDFLNTLSKETNAEKNLFYGALLMLATNNSIGLELFLDKNGVKLTKNKSLLNEDKITLLKTYRSYLAANRGKGEIDSPLNPTDPEEKEKVIALFKSNTYNASKNIELVKINNLFFWKASWGSLQGLFTNEERRLTNFTYKNQDDDFIMEAMEYTSFNGINEMPKILEIKNTQGLIAKFQITGQEVSSKRDFEEFKKKVLPKRDAKEILPFLY